MTIFGLLNYTLNHTVYTHNATSGDACLNYLFSTLLIMSFLVSTILNPIIVLYNRHQRSSVLTILFQLLAVSNFATNLYHPLSAAFNLVYTEYSFTGRYRTDPTLLEQTNSAVFSTLVLFSGTLTALLSITRYLAVQCPHVKLKKRYMVLYCGGCFTTILGVFVITTFAQTKFFSRYSQLAWNDYSASALVSFIRCVYSAHIIPALIISLNTVQLLVRGDVHQQTFLPSQTQGSNLTILIMNCGTFIYFFIMVIALVLGSPTRFSSHSMILALAPLEFVYAVMVPCMLAAFNPAVIFLCSTSMRSRLRVSLSRTKTEQEAVVLTRVRDVTIALRRGYNNRRDVRHNPAFITS